MKLLGKKSLYDFKNQHTDAKNNIESWESEVEDASWKTPHEMKQYYPTADPVHSGNTIFNICGNKYRLWALMDYLNQIVLVKKIGTHKEYDGWKIK
jgi:mRNA interferase HigB